MNVARHNPTVTAVNTSVLVSGGFNGAFLNSMEVYYTASATFGNVSNMQSAREGHTATVLSDGRVLLTGGCKNSQADKIACDEFLNSAEIWDPSTNTTTLTTGKMIAARSEHTATLLPNGKVLIAGGRNATSILNSAEIFDPSTGLFTVAGNLQEGRKGQTATLLNDGRVLLAGGYSTHSLASAEVYSQGAFTLVSSPLSAPRSKHTATLLSNGKVLLTGGENTDLLMLDVNYRSNSDNVSPQIVFSSDSKTGFVPYTGSGVVLAFSSETGAVVGRIVTGGRPALVTPLLDGKTLAIVSALDNKIFFVRMDALTLQATYNFNGTFGFGSVLSLSPDGNTGYVSSTDTGEVIKFNISTGQESGRFTGMKEPAQITVTKDGSTLLVVDTANNDVVFVDAGTMREKYRTTPLAIYPFTNFTISNKAVLNADESYGVIGSQDLIPTSNDTIPSSNAIIVFRPSTGELVRINQIGVKPGYTALLPDGSAWLILCSDGLAALSTSDMSIVNRMPIYKGAPLESANVLISSDSKYAYYTSASSDLLLEQSLITKGIIGSIPVGDSAEKTADQASSIALTPNAKTMAVLSFMSNQIDLLKDSYLLKQTKFASLANQFTGLSIINLSSNATTINIAALNNSGSKITGDTITNPSPLTLAPNEQKAFDLTQLFDLSTGTDQTGRLTIESDQPAIVAFSATGQVHPDFLNPYTSGLQAIPFIPDYHYQQHDFIIPEIPFESQSSIEINLVNPTFSNSTYTATHYGEVGSVLENSADQAVLAANRVTRNTGDIVSTTHLGDVLLVGGAKGAATLKTSELYQQNFFFDSGSLSQSRRGQSATLLLSGKILIAGGKNESAVSKTAEIYDVTTGQFTKARGTMTSPRYRHTATLLLDGKVLIAGGQNAKSISSTAEVFDPETRGITAVSGYMTSARDGHTATLLPNGDVLIVGGIDGYSISKTGEIYDAAHSVFRAAKNNMTAGRVFHTAVLLSNGKVLIAGGFNGSNYLSSAEIYDPSTGYFSAIPSMSVARSGLTGTLLPNGTVLIAGGLNSSGPTKSVELFDPAVMSFLPPANAAMASARVWHTATLVADKTNPAVLRVLITGGYDGSSTLDSAEFYDPITQLFTTVNGIMKIARQNHTAIGLRGGNQGYVRVTSEIGLLSTEIHNHGGADASINGIDMDAHVGVSKIYSPQFTISTGFPTLINIINGNQDNPANVTLKIFSSNGSTMGAPVERVVPKNGQIKGNLWDIFGNNAALLNQTGWLEVSSSEDQIVGTISFTDSNNKILTSFELSGTPLSHFLFPLVSQDAVFKTEIALLNADEQQSTNVQLEFWDLSGTLIASKSVSLAKRSLYFGSIKDLFGVDTYRSANVRITSDRPIHGFAMLSDRLLRFISAMPPVPFPGQ
jgi:hypothetical protein